MRGTTRTKKDVPKVHAAFPVCTANFRVNRGASLQPNRTGLALFASTAPTSGVISIQIVDARPIWTRLPEVSVAGDVGNDESDDSIRAARARSSGRKCGTRSRAVVLGPTPMGKTTPPGGRNRNENGRAASGVWLGMWPNPHRGLVRSPDPTN
jgi:hypothetical protein